MLMRMPAQPPPSQSTSPAAVWIGNESGVETQLAVRGLELAAVEYHERDEGVPILALHGWLDSAASFERLAPLLAPHHVLAVDLPGHGRSSHKAAWETYHYVDWATLVFDIADARGWERFHLIGHSMGAGIACLAAGALPERIARLILLDGLGPLSDSEEAAPARVRRYIEQRANRPAPKRLADQAAAAERLRRAMPPLSADSARRLAHRSCRNVDTEVEWSNDARLRLPSVTRFTENQVRAFLTQITAPALVIRALEGYAFDERLMSARLACLRTHRYVESPGGHHVHLDAPERVAPHIVDWLDSQQQHT